MASLRAVSQAAAPGAVDNGHTDVRRGITSPTSKTSNKKSTKSKAPRAPNVASSDRGGSSSNGRTKSSEGITSPPPLARTISSGGFTSPPQLARTISQGGISLPPQRARTTSSGGIAPPASLARTGSTSSALSGPEAPPPPPLPPKRRIHSNLDDLVITGNTLDDIKSSKPKLRTVPKEKPAPVPAERAPASTASTGWRAPVTQPHVTRDVAPAVSRDVPRAKQSAATRGNKKGVVKGTKVKQDIESFHMAAEVELPRKYSNSEIVSHPDETFGGRRDFLDCQSDTLKSITSGKGSVRGFKNRVKAGVTTFIEQSDNQLKDRIFAKDKDKILLYTTSSRVIRATSEACATARKILQNLLVKFEERDLFMNPEVQLEMLEKKGLEYMSDVTLPQIFIDNQCIGSTLELDHVNESGELRRILKNFKRVAGPSTCRTCGGYGRVPCPVCGGSKKSLHRNCLTDELSALRCVQCDASGLQACAECKL